MDEHAVPASPPAARGDPSTSPPSAVDQPDRLRRTDTASSYSSHVTDAPPFWSRHGRSASYHSVLQNENADGQIILEDHSDERNEQTQACWARTVTIDEGVLVSGSTGIGAYIVWHCTVSTLKGGDINLRKRYSEFDRLREDLVRSFPHAEAMIPELPRKSVVSRFRPKFLEARQAGLSHFLTCILLNPEFAASPVLKDFIFA